MKDSFLTDFADCGELQAGPLELSVWTTLGFDFGAKKSANEQVVPCGVQMAIGDEILDGVGVEPP